MLSVFGVAWLLLVIGDFLSTFCYHVPEHVFGRLHLQVHHAPKKNFRHYAVLSGKPAVLADGILGALPYVLVAVPLWNWSWWGVILGLVFGQFHVWWRHTTALGWRTPGFIVVLCRWTAVTTPEQHWVHHHNTAAAFGDIFTFFDVPARMWMRQLRRLRAARRRYALLAG